LLKTKIDKIKNSMIISRTIKKHLKNISFIEKSKENLQPQKNNTGI